MDWYYLAGPMTGHELFNYGVFERVATDLRKAGHSIRSPHEIDHGETEKTRGTKPYNVYIAKAIVLMMSCNNIILLPDWSKSYGARQELSLALTLDMKIWYYKGNGKIMEIR